jgi:uncharacterized protein YacL
MRPGSSPRKNAFDAGVMAGGIALVVSLVIGLFFSWSVQTVVVAFLTGIFAAFVIFVIQYVFLKFVLPHWRL